MHRPLTDFYTHDNHYLLVMSLPGAREESIDLQVRGRLLSVEAQREVPQDVSRLFEEMPHPKMRRVFRLEAGTNMDGIEAKYEHGLLNITIPRNNVKKKISITAQ